MNTESDLKVTPAQRAVIDAIRTRPYALTTHEVMRATGKRWTAVQRVVRNLQRAGIIEERYDALSGCWFLDIHPDHKERFPDVRI